MKLVIEEIKLGPSPGGRNKAKVVPIKKGNYWFESNISPSGRNCLQPALIWAVRISAYYTGFASLIEGFNSPTVQSQSSVRS